MAEITIIRLSPPSYAICRAPACQRRIEWVRTEAGRLMPVDVPLTVLRSVPRLDGITVSVIDGGQSHFATCPGAARFRRPRPRA